FLACISSFAASASACPCIPQARLFEVRASIDAARIPPGAWGGAVLGDQWIWFGESREGPRVVVRDGDADARSAPLTHAAYQALQDAWDAMLRDATPDAFELETLEGEFAFFGGSHDPAKFRYAAGFCLLPDAPAARLFDLIELLSELVAQEEPARRALVPWIEANARAAHALGSE
ncbi:MAG TPA: hypothetical protein VII78_06460, partial [Myxococcota bacterium]